MRMGGTQIFHCIFLCHKFYFIFKPCECLTYSKYFLIKNYACVRVTDLSYTWANYLFFLCFNFLICATRIIKPTMKYLEQDLAHKILPLQGKILVRVFKALKINCNPIFKKHLNNINHTISEKDAIFELDSVLNTYKIAYLIHTKSLCDRNYPLILQIGN